MHFGHFLNKLNDFPPHISYWLYEFKGFTEAKHYSYDIMMKKLNALKVFIILAIILSFVTTILRYTIEI